MKRIFTYIALVAATLLTACSDSDNFSQVVGGGDLGYLESRNTISMPSIVHEENWEGNSDLSSKSSLSYKWTTGRLLFEWHVNDKVGVYPVKSGQQNYLPENSTISEWNIYRVESTTDDRSVGIFDSDDEHISTHTGESYIAVSPYIADDTDYRDIPITYEGQVQSASAKIGAYIKRATSGEEAKYSASEVEACAHLSKYDYLVDTERAANEQGGKMRFEMKRLSSIVRFYMKVPERIVYDSLQLCNSSKEFTLKTLLNAAEGQFIAEPTKKGHAISLQTNKFGFDYTGCTENDDYYYNSSIGWVMVCYMMMAPIDLSAAETAQSTLYLIGREPHYYANVTEYNTAKGTNIDETTFNNLPQQDKMKVYLDADAFNTAKGLTGADALNAGDFAALSPAQKMSESTQKTYKATLAKKNLQADVLYQWTTAGFAEDEPITFEEISIEEWKTGTTFTNDDGDGTEEW